MLIALVAGLRLPGVPCEAGEAESCEPWRTRREGFKSLRVRIVVVEERRCLGATPYPRETS